MAIYHFSAKTVSRAEGRSSVAAAAYRSGERLIDQRTGEICDYTRKGGIVGGGVVLPGGGTLSRSELWNRVEAKHKRGDALVAREFELALPHELDDAQRMQLTADYARELADKYGVAVDYNLHAPDDGGLNQHAHVMLSACHATSTGDMGKKCVELDPIHCKRAGILNPMETQRERWQDLCNAALERAGQDERIDHRTLAAQGITDRLPGTHLGPAAAGMSKRGEMSDIELRAKRKLEQFLADMQAVVTIEKLLADARKSLRQHEAFAAYQRAQAATAAARKAHTKAERAHFDVHEAHLALLNEQRQAGESVLATLLFVPKLPKLRDLEKREAALDAQKQRAWRAVEAAQKSELDARKHYVALVPQPQQAPPPVPERRLQPAEVPQFQTSEAHKPSDVPRG